MPHSRTRLVLPRRVRGVASVSALALLAAPLAALLPAQLAQADTTPPLSVKVNFQPDATAVPAGFTKDVGGAYSDTSGMGWVRQDSLSGTHTPYAVPLNVRDRSTCTALTVQQRTMIHMQAPSTTATNDATPVAWEYQVPNGTYQVTVGVGDASKGADPESHTVNVEGVTAVKAFPASTASSCDPKRLTTGTVAVDVTDGRLTVDALGGTNTKLEYVTIDSAPDPVTGLKADPTPAAIDLSWTASASAVSYKVFRSSNRPVSTTGTPFATTTSTSFSDTTAVKGSVYYYDVRAVNDAGVSSSAALAGAVIDDPAPAQPAMPVQVNFTKQNGTAVDGYTADYGQNFANIRGYGWVEPGTQNPLNLVGNGRERNDSTVADKRLDTFVHMQGDTVPNFTGIAQPGAWELAVADGHYDVELAVGEPSPGTDPTNHVISVEGQKAVDGFVVTSTTSGAARFKTATVTDVPVSDGRLTVDALGGTNTKIDYITVTPHAGAPVDAPPAAPAGLAATAGNASVALDWADNTESDLAGYRVYRSTEATVAPDSGHLLAETTTSTYVDATASNGTAYHYVVTAVDAAGNASGASDPVTATPAAPAASGCPKISTRACDTVPTTLPVRLTFDGTQGGLVDSAGKGTGFTMVDPPSARLAVDGAPTYAAAPGYEPSKLALVPGGLQITSTKGIAYSTPSASTETNSQLDTLGVGVAAANKVLDLTTTVRGIDFPTKGNSEQAGLWFGLDEDNYVKLAVVNNGSDQAKIQLLREVGAAATPSQTYELDSAPFAEGQDVALTLHVDGTTQRVSATYQIAGGAPTALVDSANTVSSTDQPIPAGFTAGTTLSDGSTGPLSFAGLYTTSRRSTTPSAYIKPVFTGFSVTQPAAADTTAPAAPADLAATAGDGSVSLSWTANSESDLAGYRVYRSTEATVAPDSGHLLAETTTSAYDDTTAANGTTYHYLVTAVDKAGNESAASAIVDASPTGPADTTPPAAPAGLAATAGDASVSLSWTAGTESDLAGYRVYRSAVAGGQRTELTTAAQRGTTFVDDTAANDTQYFYVVTAQDAAGNSSAASNEVSATPEDTTAPAAPKNVAATPGQNSVTLTWDSNTEPDLFRYVIYRSTTADVPTDRAHLVGSKAAGRTGEVFLDSGLTPGTRYSYVIVAEDQVGNVSAASAIVQATPKGAPDTTAPDAPTGLAATVDSAKVNLTWTGSTASDVTGYNVYRSSTAGGTAEKLTSTPEVGTSYTDVTAPAGATSYYVVTAVDASNNESAASNQASAAVAASGLQRQAQLPDRHRPGAGRLHRRDRRRVRRHPRLRLGARGQPVRRHPHPAGHDRQHPSAQPFRHRPAAGHRPAHALRRHRADAHQQG